MNVIVLAIVNALLLAVGQVLWKMGIRQTSITSAGELLGSLLNPFVIAGLLVYVFTTLLWLYIINKAEIGYVYPLQSLAFVFVSIAGIVLFGEHFAINRILGLLLIVFGVFLVSIK